MTIFQEACHELKRDELTKEVYRFQGAKTRSNFSLVDDDLSRDYIYFSNSLDHHKYFSVKRIKQLLNSILLEEEGIPLSNKTLHNNDGYNAIRNLIINTDKFKSLYTFRLVLSDSFDGLIRDNYQYNIGKKSGFRGIERVDRRVYGGGYGVSDEWKQLMVYLTYFSLNHKITRDELLKLIRNMRMTNRISRKDNIDFLFQGTDLYSYEINPHLYSDFNKYNIINALEMILEKDLVLPDSELARHPHQTIKGVVDEYEKGREKTLKILDKRKY